MAKKKDTNPDIEDAEVVQPAEPETESVTDAAEEAEVTPEVSEPESPAPAEIEAETAVPAHEDHDVEDHEAEDLGTSLSARVLQGLALMAIGGAVALWGAPKLAPVLPRGMAPVAEFLMPGQSESKVVLDALRSDLQNQIAAIAAKPSGGVSQADIDRAIAAYGAQVSKSLSALRDQMNASDGPEIESRLAALESRFAGVAGELSTMSDRLSLQINENGSALSQEAASKLAGYQSVIDGLKAQVEKLAATTGALSHKIDAVSVTSARRIKEAETAASVEVATTATTKFITDISFALDTGSPFKAALDGLAKVADVTAPPALAAIAATGTASWSDLRSQFPDVANTALRAETQAKGQSGVFGKLGAFLKTQIASRSLERREGDSADAVLSRIEDELGRGNLAMAITESESLPPASKAAAAEWLTGLDRLAAAQSALTELSSALGVSN